VQIAARVSNQLANGRCAALTEHWRREQPQRCDGLG
jgi:hypothetical protein